MKLTTFEQVGLPADASLKKVFNLLRDEIRYAARHGDPKLVPEYETMLVKLTDNLKISMTLPELARDDVMRVLSLGFLYTAHEMALMSRPETLKSFERRVLTIANNASYLRDLADSDVFQDRAHNLDTMDNLSTLSEDARLLAAIGLVSYAQIADEAASDDVREKVGQRVRVQASSLVPGSIPETLHTMLNAWVRRIDRSPS